MMRVAFPLKVVARATAITVALCLGHVIFVIESLPERFTVDFLIVTGFLVTGIISVYNLARSNLHDGISLRVIFWFFGLVFFAVTPYLKYISDEFREPVSETAMLTANALIVLFLLLFHFMYGHVATITKAKLRKRPDIPVRRGVWLDVSPFGMKLSIAISYIIAGAFIANNGLAWEQLVGQREEFGPAEQISQFYFRPFTFFTFLFAVVYFWHAPVRRLRHYGCLLFSSLPAILLNFPFSTNRFYVFAIYLGLMVILFPPSSSNRTLYLSVLFAGIVGSFLVDAILRSTFEEAGVFATSYLTGLTFDAYESFCYAIDYAAKNGITWGSQLLGGLLFWVPRSMWPTKPVGTGSFITSQLHGARFTNVSAPFIEEGYINFSVAGVIAFALFLGFITASMDVRYKAAMQALRANKFWRNRETYLVYYPVTIGVFLFMLRGDFMSSFAYFSGMSFSFFTARRFMLRPFLGIRLRQL